MLHAFCTVANLSRYCSMLQKIYHIPHLLNGLKLGLVWDICQIFSIWHISHIYCGCSYLLLFDFSTPLFSYLSFHLFVFPPLCFSAFFSWTIFGLHSLGFLGIRHTCTGLCMHFLYISSILGELVLVFL